MEEPYLRALKEQTFKLKLTAKAIFDKLGLEDLYLYATEEQKEASPLDRESLEMFLSANGVEENLIV